MSEPYEPRDDRGRRNLEQAHAAQARKQARADARAETASREPWYRRDGWILAMAGLRTAHSSLALIAWLVSAVLVVILVAVVTPTVQSGFGIGIGIIVEIIEFVQTPF